MMALPPDQVPGSSDVGADTLQRYRHQATCAAIVSLATLEEDGDIAELFCEHHEDILVKHRDGKFVGNQLKTEDRPVPPRVRVRIAAGRQSGD